MRITLNYVLMSTLLSFSLFSSANAVETFSDAKMEMIGRENPIGLSVISLESLLETLGPKLANGDQATIFEVANSRGERIYKLLPVRELINGDVIRISEMAGELGVGPKIYRSFIVRDSSNTYVGIEMDRVERSMGKWMEYFAADPNDSQHQDVMPTQASHGDNYEVVLIETKPRLDLDAAISKMYSRPEVFYVKFFNRIKTLAENNISYGDSHVGNIIPNYNTDKELMLIDFDDAQMTRSTKEAVAESLSSAYVRMFLHRFSSLPNKSQESRDLIRWFMLN